MEKGESVMVLPELETPPEVLIPPETLVQLA